MSEDIKPENGAIPPRVTIKVPGQSGEVSPATPAESFSGATKKKTARISLDQTGAEPGATQASFVSGVGVASKTIRLAPAMSSGQLTPSSMPVGKALSGILTTEDGKHKTSRIPLEAVLAGKGETPSGGGDDTPKTIKVKRPTISIGSKVSSMPVAEEPVSTHVQPGVPSSKTQTARVDVIPDVVVEAQQTQKKTIKIRRAEGSSGVESASRNVSIARTEGASATSMDRAQVAAPHWIFPALAAVALLVVCFMIYVLSAQAYPNLGWSLGG